MFLSEIYNTNSILTETLIIVSRKQLQVNVCVITGASTSLAPRVML